MYDYITGSVVELSPTEVVIDNNGIGFKVLISLQTYSAIQGFVSSKLFIYHYLHEDDEVLYGFSNKEERLIFTLLISVSGIGPNTARMMLSSLSSEEITNAIIAGDVNKIKSVKGIGLKTAQRTIIELKDKIGKGNGSNIDLGVLASSSSVRSEACSALVLLGFSKNAVEKALDTALKTDPSCSLEILIKKALKLL